MRIFAKLLSLLTAVSAMCAAAWAVALGAAGEQFVSGAQAMWSARNQADRTGKRAMSAEMAALEQELAAAIEWAPAHGHLRLTQFFVARTPRETPEGAVVENEALAQDAIHAALARLPHSPVAWAEYALVADRRHSEGRLTGGAQRLGEIIQRALILGPREPNVMLVMLNLGLRNWDELDATTRSALEQAVSRFNAARRDASIQIAQRRGRVAELCGMAPMRSHRECLKLAQAAAAASPAEASAAPSAPAAPQ